MAHTRNTNIDQTLIVQSATTRDYGFSFPYTAVEDVFVEVRGEAVGSTRYRITSSSDRQSGLVHFLDSSESTDPVTLYQGDEIRIYRDTLLRRTSSFGHGGLVQASAMDGYSRYTYRLLEE